MRHRCSLRVRFPALSGAHSLSGARPPARADGVGWGVLPLEETRAVSALLRRAVCNVENVRSVRVLYVL